MARTLSVDERMWEDGFESKEDFFAECEKSLKSCQKSYFPDGMTRRGTDNHESAVLVYPWPGSEVRFAFGLESLWNEYINGWSWSKFNLYFEQQLDRV